MNQPNEHHLAAAKRWIQKNGMPATEEQRIQMAHEVVAEANRVVADMAEKALQALSAAHEDSKHNTRTLEGDKGRDFLNTIYRKVAA